MLSRPLILVILCLAVGLTLAIGGQRSAMKAGDAGDPESKEQDSRTEPTASTLLVSKVKALSEEDRVRFESVRSALDSLKDRPEQSAGLWKSLASFWLTRQDFFWSSCLFGPGPDLGPQRG